jgi:ATP-dependent DNA ligase
MNVEILEQVAATSKKNAKQLLLKKLDEQGQRLVKLALSQDVTFGVTVEEDESLFHEKNWKAFPNEFWERIEKFLARTAKRDLTGNAALNEMKLALSCAPTKLDLKWAIRIINRDLQAGFSRNTYNKAFGEDEVQKFEVQLAETYEDQEMEGEWLFEPKLNGNRVVAIDEIAKSRGNREYTAAEHVMEQLRDINGFFEDFVLDGEMMGNLGFDQSSGALRRKDSKNKDAVFTYWVFDIFTRKEWDTQDTAILRERKKTLRWLFETKGKNFMNIQMVPGQIIKNPTRKQVLKLTQEYVDNGFEGAMAKRLDSKAKFDRSNDLLKCKLFYDADLKVVDFYEGKNQHKGSLGGIWVEGTINGRPVRSKVGSGFGHKFDPKEPDKVLRQDVWKNKKDWLGAVVQVQYQEHTKKGSLQFPVFIMRRKDKE